MTEKQKIKLEMEKERIKGMRDFENGQIRQFLGLGDGCTFIAAGMREEDLWRGLLRPARSFCLRTTTFCTSMTPRSCRRRSGICSLTRSGKRQ